MKKIIFAAALTLLCTASLKAQQTEAFPSYVTVNGYAEREVTPDELYVGIIIEENNSKGKVSIAEQQRKMIDKLRGLGINVEKDLQVGDMSSDSHSYILRKDKTETQKKYVLKIGSADMLSKVYQELVSINISKIKLITVNRSDIEQIKTELSIEAMKNAQETAKTLAGAIGQTIGKAFQIVDENINIRHALKNMVYGLSVTPAEIDDIEEDTSLDFKDISVASAVNVQFILN